MNDSNVIFIEILNKKHFPNGDWMKEPDLCQWEKFGLKCLLIRDMGLGFWRGFVGVDENHSLYEKSHQEFLSEEMKNKTKKIHGGIVGAGRLPPKYKNYDAALWWFVIEAGHDSDVMPLVKLDVSDPSIAKIVSKQTYKTFSFLRKETNKLAKVISEVTD